MSEIERHARALELARRIVTAQGRTDDDPRIHDARDVARAYIDRMEPVTRKREGPFFQCGTCGEDVFKGQNFCPNCGKPIKWKDAKCPKS